MGWTVANSTPAGGLSGDWGPAICRKGTVSALIPPADPEKRQAIQYAFHRADTASVSHRQLAHELQAKGYPGPGRGWSWHSARRMLINPIYAGIARWGATARGKYWGQGKPAPWRFLAGTAARYVEGFCRSANVAHFAFQPPGAKKQARRNSLLRRALLSRGDKI
jgi:hypothetical protein